MDAPPLRASKNGLVLVVWVVPGSNRTESAGLHGEALKIRVAAAASEGAANEALLRFLSRRLGCDVAMISGRHSRNKRIRIDSDDLAGVAQLLGIAPG
ncbi:MAG: YggU family protein [Acidimicrobiia bacterium]|nr:YggU family protein [Acidimicrobiia bacterium]